MAEIEMDEAARETLSDKAAAPAVGDCAPQFFIDTPSGRLTIGELAARVGTVVLVSLDSYQFHPPLNGQPHCFVEAGLSEDLPGRRRVGGVQPRLSGAASGFWH